MTHRRFPPQAENSSIHGKTLPAVGVKVNLAVDGSSKSRGHSPTAKSVKYGLTDLDSRSFAYGEIAHICIHLIRRGFRRATFPSRGRLFVATSPCAGAEFKSLAKTKTALCRLCFWCSEVLLLTNIALRAIFQATAQTATQRRRTNFPLRWCRVQKSRGHSPTAKSVKYGLTDLDSRSFAYGEIAHICIQLPSSRLSPCHLPQKGGLAPLRWCRVQSLATRTKKP